jgi:hypothetical protein
LIITSELFQSYYQRYPQTAFGNARCEAFPVHLEPDEGLESFGNDYIFKNGEELGESQIVHTLYGAWEIRTGRAVWESLGLTGQVLTEHIYIYIYIGAKMHLMIDSRTGGFRF